MRHASYVVVAALLAAACTSRSRAADSAHPDSTAASGSVTVADTAALRASAAAAETSHAAAGAAGDTARPSATRGASRPALGHAPAPNILVDPTRRTPGDTGAHNPPEPGMHGPIVRPPERRPVYPPLKIRRTKPPADTSRAR